MSKDAYVKRVPDTQLEQNIRCILAKLKTEGKIGTFISHHWIETPLYDYVRKQKHLEADFLVDHVLIVEGQGYRHTKDRRHRKDVAKRWILENMGYGVLWLWEQEVEYAMQKKRGVIWRPIVEAWILAARHRAVLVREAYVRFQNTITAVVAVPYPEREGLVNLRTRSE